MNGGTRVLIRMKLGQIRKGGRGGGGEGVLGLKQYIITLRRKSVKNRIAAFFTE